MSRSRSPLHHQVGDLLADPGRRRSVDVEATVNWEIESSRITTPVTAALTLQGTTGGVFVTGRVAAGAIHKCNRCLREYEALVEVQIHELLGGEDPEYPLDEDVADLEPPLRDALLLALPALPLCSPECLGLCATCGADLNAGACPGHEEDIESPFAALRGLLEP